MTEIITFGIPFLSKGSGIHIKKNNQGKFTQSAKQHGENVQEYAHSVVNNPKATKLQKKRAQFAINASKWKHQNGGNLSIYQDGGSFSKQASDAYQEFSDSPWGTVYDVVNTGLYAAAPFTGGATLPFAIGMSALQGAAAANNMYQEGVNLNNTLDVVGGLTALPASKVAKPIMKSVGKSTKYVRRANLVKPAKKVLSDGKIHLERVTPALWQMAAKNPKYLPYTTYVYSNIGANTGQVTNDIVDNVKTYSKPVFEQINTSKQLTNAVNEKNKYIQPNF